MSFRPYVLSVALATVTFLPVAASAQTPITFGVKAGVTASTLSANDSADLDVKTIWGGAAGVFLGKNLTPNLGLQLEGLVTQRGAKDNSFGGDTKIRLAYLDVPLTVRYGSTTTNETHYHVFTGPQISFNLKAETIDEVFGTTDVSDDVESMDFGWTLGAGVERNRLSLDARYTFGLMNLNATPSGDTIKNRSFMVLIGFRLK